MHGADESDRLENRSGQGADPAALAIALGGQTLDPRAAQYLEEARSHLRSQNDLTLLQIADLRREDRVRHWSLRVRHVSDVLKVAFELSFAFIVVVVAIWLGAAVWSAANDHDLVIEPFSVPPDFAQRGMTGEVLASDIIDKVNALGFINLATAPVAAGVYRSDNASEIKVQIPETGISIGQAYGYLVRWLGDERHISGALYRTQSGDLVLNVHIPGSPAQSFEGPEAGFNSLEQRAVEYVMAETQPAFYGLVLMRRNRLAEALAFFPRFAEQGTAKDRATLYVTWAVVLQFTDDLHAVVEKAQLARAIDPDHTTGLDLIYGTEADLGEDEASLKDAQAAIRALAAGKFRDFTEAARELNRLEMLEWIDEEAGDFQAAASEAQINLRLLRNRSRPSVLAQDHAADHDVSAARADLRNTPITGDALVAPTKSGVFSTIPPMPFLYEDIALEDWPAAAAEMTKTYQTAIQPGSPVVGYMRTLFDPWYAYTQAMVGRIAEAQALINRTPPDCYLCLRVRAKIAIEARDWSGATSWFERAVGQAPSIPFAYNDWGAMLLHRGDYDGAIAKFEEAHQKGPHFADPLEMWGEALMLKNRSDLALEKFGEANKYAPRWGRLHLKWGEALSYLGRKDEAHAQYQSARGMDLSSTDRARLARDASQLGH